LSYAPTVKDRQSSATSKRTNSYNNNQVANKLTNNNTLQQPDISHYQTPISSTQDISKSIKSSSVATYSTNNNNNSLVQPKVRISQPGDVYEQEADRVAERMMAMATNPSKPTKSSGTTVKNNDDGHLRIDRKPSQQPRHSIAAGGEAAATPAVTSERVRLEKYNLDYEKNSLGDNISSLADLSTIRRVVGQNSGGSSNSHPSESFLHLIQPKLKISQPSDAYEKEADLVADQVIGTPPTPDVAIKYQPSLGNDGKKEEEKNNNKTKSITSIVHSRNADGAPSEISSPAEHHESSTMLHSGESTSAARKAIRLSSDSLFYVRRAIGNNNNVDNKNHNHRQFANNSSKSLVHSTTNNGSKSEDRSGANNMNNKFHSARQILQPKLKVSQPGDIFEQEADRVAEKVMSMHSVHFSYSAAARPVEKSTEGKGIDKKCAACETKGQQEKIEISRKPSHASNLETSDQATNEINSVISGGSSGSSLLDANTKELMEAKFGYDLSNVRIHTDAAAAKSAESVNALAYTVGNDIVFGQGQYHPNTIEGRRLLAHELTHVLQQSSAHGNNSTVQSYEKWDSSTFSTVRHLALPGSGRSATSRLVQRQPSDTTASGERKNESSSDSMWQQVVGEHSITFDKIARVRAPKGVKLRSRPAGNAPHEVILPFDELVKVQRKTDYGWCWVVSMGKYTGKTGFCEEQYLSMDPPEPTAHLYKVQPNDTLSAIATRYYGKSMDDENNVRLYVQALYIANKAHAGVRLDEVDLSRRETALRREKEEETIKIYKGVHVRQGLAIWVPSERFIEQLKAAGMVTSGSTEVMKAWRKAKDVVEDIIWAAKYVAGFIVGLLEGAWNAIVDLFKGAVEMIEAVAKVLYHLITGNIGAIKDMLMGWVEKLKLAWKNRDKIADEFMKKWEAKDGWDRGRFQGKVLGWVMMTVLIIILTAGQGALVQATGIWRGVLQVLRTANALGDVTTYIGKGVKLPGKVVKTAMRELGVAEHAAEGVSKAPARAAGRTVEASVEAGKATQKAAADLVGVSKPVLGGTHKLTIKRIGKRLIVSLCSNGCGDVIAKAQAMLAKLPEGHAAREKLENLIKEAQSVETTINAATTNVSKAEKQVEKLQSTLEKIKAQHPDVVDPDIHVSPSATAPAIPASQQSPKAPTKPTKGGGGGGEGATPPSGLFLRSKMFDPHRKFRKDLDLPPAGSVDDTATIAQFVHSSGEDIMGINAHGQTISLKVHPIPASHAEADAFNQAARKGIKGGSATLYVDRPLCHACGVRGAILSQARQLGLKRLKIVEAIIDSITVINL
jgi:hypothetical protein